MKKLFGLFVIGILSSTAMAELVCLAPSGCAIEIETGACPTCVETSIVEPIIKSEIVRTSNSGCHSYFERNHGGRNICEVARDGCVEYQSKQELVQHRSPRLCHMSYKTCKKSELSYNKRFTKNHGKITCG